MQLPVRFMRVLTSLAVLPLLFPRLETSDVISEEFLVHVGCFNSDVDTNYTYERYVTMYNYMNWDLAIKNNCMKDVKMYIGVEPADTRSKNNLYRVTCGYELFNESGELNATACEPCRHDPSDSRWFCGGTGAMSVYKIRDHTNEPNNNLILPTATSAQTSQHRFLPLYVTGTVILMVVTILDVHFYRRCRNPTTRPNLVKTESNESLV